MRPIAICIALALILAEESLAADQNAELQSSLAQFNAHARLVPDRLFAWHEEALVIQALKGLQGKRLSIRVIGHVGRHCQAERPQAEAVCGPSREYALALGEAQAVRAAQYIRALLPGVQVDTQSVGLEAPLQLYPTTEPRTREALARWNAVASQNHRIELQAHFLGAATPGGLP
jgi:hypothetical protein